jgi:F-type H+-transporting ATPase subunit a
MHISISAEPIFNLGPLTITNSFLMGVLVSLFLILISFLVVNENKLRKIPQGLLGLFEMIIEGFYSLVQSIAGAKAKTFFPLIATFFIFIVFANWAGLLPGVGTIGFIKMTNHHEKFVPLFRGATADLNTTLALAIFSVLSTHFFGLKFLGLKHPQKFFNLKGPIDFFIGILELISEFSKILSFSFRLFGNIFAGEVLLTVMAFLVPAIAPIPFIGLELFVGLVQALVFSMLTLVFLNIATAGHEE